MPETKTTTAPVGTPAEFVMPTGEALLKLSFAELQEIGANHNDQFIGMLKGIVRMADRAKKLGKELTNGANFYGKALCIVMRRYQDGVAQKLINAASLSAYVERELGKMPARAYPALKVFSTFSLADEKAARFVPEAVYDELTSRIVNEASKIVNIAEGIKGATAETSGLSHQVFTDTAAILKVHGKTAVEKLVDIQNRLIEVETAGADGETTKNLLYITAEELAARNAAEAAQDANGELARIIGTVGIPAVLAALHAEARTTAKPDIAKALVQFGTQIAATVAANVVEGKVIILSPTGGPNGGPLSGREQIRRFTDESVLEWHAEAVELATDAELNTIGITALRTQAILAAKDPPDADEETAETETAETTTAAAV